MRLSFVGGDPRPARDRRRGSQPETPSPVTSANATMNVIQTGGRNRFEFGTTRRSATSTYSPPERSAPPPQQAPRGRRYRMFGTNATYASRTDGNGLVHTGGDLDITVAEDRARAHRHQTCKNTQTTAVTRARGDLPRQAGHPRRRAREGDLRRTPPSRPAPPRDDALPAHAGDHLAHRRRSPPSRPPTRCSTGRSARRRPSLVANTSNQTCGLLLLTVDGATKITSTRASTSRRRATCWTAPIYNPHRRPLLIFSCLHQLAQDRALTVSIIYGLKTTAEGGKGDVRAEQVRDGARASFTLGGFKMEIVSQKKEEEGPEDQGRGFELRAGRPRC